MVKQSLSKNLTIGLPLMHQEKGEKRCFLPKLISCMDKYGAQVTLEHGYGEEMGVKKQDYLDAAPSVKFDIPDAVFQKDIVLVLRCPPEDYIKKMKPGSCLISMLHYATRPKRINLLRSHGLRAISLDSIKDDSGRRMVENFNAVAWNGMEAAFLLLQDIYPQPGFFSQDRPPIQVTLIGAGALGAHTVRAAVRYGDVSLQRKLAQVDIPGVIVTAVDYDITNHPTIMKDLLSKTDILVDASSRMDSSKPIISNNWLEYLPQHAIILDLCVDPYQWVGQVFHTKGIEGIPQGNLDQYVFSPGDPIYEKIPMQVPTNNRRHTIACYSWPGIHPLDCMHVYGQQLHPIMRTLVSHGGVSGIDPAGRFFERAIGRALLSSIN